MEFLKDGLSLTTQVQEKVLKLYKEILERILDIPIIGVRTVMNQQPTIEFIIEASNIRVTSIAVVKKKFLKSEYQLVLSPRS